MEAKPYQIQSPQAIAMQYGGDKQRISQAMQTGVVDPTSGLLASMFIDRMRSATAAEQAPHNTVAQQVMGLQRPQAYAPGPGPQSGPPQGLPSIQGGQKPPQPQAPAAPQFANGGIANLPLPDNMFQEPNNGGYAGGGIIAFDDGGEAALGKIMATPVSEADVKNAYAPGLLDIPYAPQDAGKKGKDAPAPTADNTVPTVPTADQPATTVMGNPTDFTSAYGNILSAANLQHTYSDMAQKEYANAADPGVIKAQADQNRSNALLNMGLHLMGSSSPNFLQAVGQAGSAVMPSYQEAQQQQQTQRANMLEKAAAHENIANELSAKLLPYGIDTSKNAMQAGTSLSDTGAKIQEGLINAQVTAKAKEVDAYIAQQGRLGAVEAARAGRPVAPEIQEMGLFTQSWLQDPANRGKSTYQALKAYYEAKKPQQQMPIPGFHLDPGTGTYVANGPGAPSTSGGAGTISFGNLKQ